jgi:hypothetical protein
MITCGAPDIGGFDGLDMRLLRPFGPEMAGCAPAHVLDDRCRNEPCGRESEITYLRVLR